MDILFVIQHYKLLYIMKTEIGELYAMFAVLAVAGVVNGQHIAGNETKETMPAGTTIINGSMLGNMICADNMTT